MGMAVKPNPNRPFLLRFGLLKVADLIAAKITWAWSKNKGDAAPYFCMDEIMKYISYKSSLIIMVASKF
jgi:hypothetical protein